MSEKKDIAFLLKTFSLKQNTAQFDLIDFCLFVQRYSAKFCDRHPELADYTNVGTEEMAGYLREMKNDGEIEYIQHSNGNASIVVAHFYIEKVNKIFNAISEKPTIAFPTRQDLPKDITGKFLRKLTLDSEFAEIQPTNGDHEFIYELSFGATLPSLVFPSSMSNDTLLQYSLLKLREYLQKDESGDYVYKRLITANTGKNFTIKTFLSNIVQHPSEALNTIKSANEIYLLWGQICTFIIQEFDKKSEKLAEELSLLQGVRIIEFMSTYYRTKNQKKLQSETALKNLRLCLQQQPYYFTLLSIANFKDSRGIPLLGQYEQSDLQNYINMATTETGEYSLPDLLMLKNETGETYFVMTSKVIPLIIYLINQNRKKIQEEVVRVWKDELLDFNKTEAMKDDKVFDEFLKTITKNYANNLYSLLNSKFLVAIANDKKIIETQAIEYSRIFPQGRIAPYSKLLLIDRDESLKDAKIMLPFWYGIPILYAVISFFKRKKTTKSGNNAENQKQESEKKQTERKPTMQERARDLKAQLLPEGETYELVMEKYLSDWNQNLNKTLRDNLTEDVNSLIRDYVRGIQRTLNINTLTPERISELANRVVTTPSLMQIPDKNALQKYSELYILDLMQKFF